VSLDMWPHRLGLTQCSVPTKDMSVEETGAVSLISSYDYHVVRSYLEQCEDLAILADVIGITASSLDVAVLASVADTLHYHMKAFRAIGAFDPLLGRLATRYAAIRTVKFPERELLLSLQNLACTAQPKGQLLQLLSYDLSRLDQKNAVAACSPASDNMGEVMQHTGTCSDDEVERVLSSGTNMDQQMMSRVLRKIMDSSKTTQVGSGGYATSTKRPLTWSSMNGWSHASWLVRYTHCASPSLPWSPRAAWNYRQSSTSCAIL
jgi:hypothetical protein